jgi:hypothetical protein
MRFTRTTLAAVAVSALIVAMAVPALAGKPTKYDLAVPDGYYGETVVATATSGATAKTASTSETTDYTYWRVLATCYQGGELVMKHYALFDGTYSTIPLGPTRAWQEGDAECTAELGYFHKGWHTRWRSVDSTTFVALWSEPATLSDVASADGDTASVPDGDSTERAAAATRETSTATSLGGALFFAI